MSRAKTWQNWIAARATRPRGAALALCALLFAAASPASANRVTQVRVGNHPTYTRLVFEMESFAGYQVKRMPGSDGGEQLTVTIEASSAARDIRSTSVGIESVSVAAGADKAIAQIRLRKPGLQMKEMILSNPPRIVLDFLHSAEAVAELRADPYAKPAPKPAAKPQPVVAKVPEPKPAPQPEAKPAPAPKPEPAVASKPEPKLAPVVAPKPEPKPAPVVAPKPEPKPQPVVAKVPEPKPAPQPEAKPAPAPKPEPAVA
ncbi:MAG TPA: hypothetical protein VEC18_09745, partial [Myxococcota bacterium]|nr:hypothetical protein [Myxococcota bacterium]